MEITGPDRPLEYDPETAQGEEREQIVHARQQRFPRADPEAPVTNVAAEFEREGLENASCISGRISAELLQAELETMMSSEGGEAAPCCEKQQRRARRIVISGPEGFNHAVREMATGT